MIKRYTNKGHLYIGVSRDSRRYDDCRFSSCCHRACHAHHRSARVHSRHLLHAQVYTLYTVSARIKSTRELVVCRVISAKLIGATSSEDNTIQYMHV